MESHQLSRDARTRQDYELLSSGWEQVVRRVFERTRLDGCRDEIVLGPFRTEEEACAEWVTQQAIMYGWTPPRWWQFWRWNDHPRGLS